VIAGGMIELRDVKSRKGGGRRGLAEAVRIKKIAV
jgi:hypothetical protein